MGPIRRARVPSYRFKSHGATLASGPAQRSSTRIQLHLKIDQRLLAHADKALSRPLEIDDNPKHHRDCQRHHADCEGLPDSLKTSRALLFLESDILRKTAPPRLSSSSANLVLHRRSGCHCSCGSTSRQRPCSQRIGREIAP